MRWITLADWSGVCVCMYRLVVQSTPEVPGEDLCGLGWSCLAWFPGLGPALWFYVCGAAFIVVDVGCLWLRY